MKFKLEAFGILVANMCIMLMYDWYFIKKLSFWLFIKRRKFIKRLSMITDETQIKTILENTG